MGVVPHRTGPGQQRREREAGEVAVLQGRPGHGGTLSSPSMGSAVAVEEVTRGKPLVRFTELPLVLHGADPCFAWPVMAWERYRLDTRRNPYFDTGDGAYFLARRLGRPAGRIAAHIDAAGGIGRFGCWSTEDDPTVAAALVEAAREWLDAQGCTSMEGPRSFTTDEEEGVLVAGHDVPGTTGRPWQPPSQARLLEGLGFEALRDRPSWRLAAAEHGPQRPPSDDVPGHAGRHTDRRLVLEGVAAVPDLSAALRDASLRDAWRLARRARAGDWTTATIVRCDDDPSLAVPALLAAAGQAGYREVIAPWSPDPVAPPETIHRTYRLTW